MIAGACAGALAAGVTNPFDVTKTLLNTQEPLLENRRIAGVVQAFQTIYRVRSHPVFPPCLRLLVFPPWLCTFLKLFSGIAVFTRLGSGVVSTACKA